IAAGRPAATGTATLGMFEVWGRVIGGILRVAEIPGFLGNLAAFYDASDTEGAALRAFVAAWWGRFAERKVGVAELYGLATEGAGELDLGDKGERSQRIRLGRILGELRDRH